MNVSCAGMVVHHDRDPVYTGYEWTSQLLLKNGLRTLTLKLRLDSGEAATDCSSLSGERPIGSWSELCPLPPCGIIRLPNRGRGEGLFSCPFSLSLDWLDRPRVAGGLVEHFQRITINTAPSGTYWGGEPHRSWNKYSTFPNGGRNSPRTVRASPATTIFTSLSDNPGSGAWSWR